MNTTTQATTTAPRKASKAKVTKPAKAKATKAAPAKPEPKAHTGHHEFYKQAYLSGWLPDVCGPAPALNLFDVVHAIDANKRPGHEALHIAMALRPQGCTVREFQVAGSCGPANNYRRALVSVDKVITVTTLPGGDGRAYRFKAVLTAKGRDMVKAALGKVPAQLEAKPDAPKAPRKRKAKATPAPAPAPAGDTTAPQA